MRTKLALLAALVLSTSTLAAHSDEYFDQGVKLYAQRRYKEACAYFDQSARNSPDANSLYYAALSRHQMGDVAGARQVYKQVTEQFPGSQGAQLAGSALKALTKTTNPMSKGSPGSAYQQADPDDVMNSGGEIIAPEMTRLYYKEIGGNLYIEGEVNGRRMPWVFDTGASITMLGKNHLQMLGITPPTGKPDGVAGGVGGSGYIPLWHMTCDLKVGGITRKNFKIAVAEVQAAALLGQTFFNAFEYRIDKADSSIVLIRKGSSYSTAKQRSTDDRYAVPFRTEGNEMVVRVEVNGRPYEMYFDTGASGTAMCMQDVRALNLKIPENAQTGFSSGIGGLTMTRTFPVGRVKMGPIEQYNYPVAVVENAAMGKPLLGQTFYRDWQYTIDNEHKVIRFMRR